MLFKPPFPYSYIQDFLWMIPYSYYFLGDVDKWEDFLAGDTANFVSTITVNKLQAKLLYTLLFLSVCP